MNLFDIGYEQGTKIERTQREDCSYWPMKKLAGMPHEKRWQCRLKVMELYELRIETEDDEMVWNGIDLGGGSGKNCHIAKSRLLQQGGRGADNVCWKTGKSNPFGTRGGVSY